MSEHEEVMKAAGVISDAVQAATGKTWSEWFEILDAANATAMSHKEIVVHLVEHYQVAPWWQQMLTVAYEQERGLREKHEAASGYQASASRTVAAPVSELFDAWADDRRRAAWLPDPAITIRKATPGKSMRITWVDGKTNIDVYFYAKGSHKSQVSIQHSKLDDADEVTRVKAYWWRALEALKTMLES